MSRTEYSYEYYKYQLLIYYSTLLYLKSIVYEENKKTGTMVNVLGYISDPAIYDYMSQSKNGEGGIYNITNLNLYHYAGNNPIKYTNPDGRVDFLSLSW